MIAACAAARSLMLRKNPHEPAALPDRNQFLHIDPSYIQTIYNRIITLYYIINIVSNLGKNSLTPFFSVI
jgi:lipoprotein NlpI